MFLVWEADPFPADILLILTQNVREPEAPSHIVSLT